MDVTAGQTVSYTLENTEAAKLKAPEDAYQHARAEAAAVAGAAQRTLGELSYASVDVSEPGRIVAPMMGRVVVNAMATPAPTEQFTPQEITVTAHMNALFTLR